MIKFNRKSKKLKKKIKNIKTSLFKKWENIQIKIINKNFKAKSFKIKIRKINIIFHVKIKNINRISSRFF